MTIRTSEKWIRDQFADHGIAIVGFETREFPQEVHHVVYVEPVRLTDALVLGSSLDIPAQPGVDEFVIVRQAPEAMRKNSQASTAAIRNVHDPRCGELVNLVSARSRVSNSQPSLAYVPDARANLAAVTAARHHLIFGRRGAGKSALLVEAKRRLDEGGAVTAWINIQTYRRESAQRVVLYILEEMIKALQAARQVDDSSRVAVALASVGVQISTLLDAKESREDEVVSLVPRVQRAFRDFVSVSDAPLFLFVDDFYYLSRADQAPVLDLLHGCTRDANVWLKIASIKHLTKWWQASPPVGLQSGQDADLIDLDITLQDPAAAKKFLEGVLLAFATKCGIPALSRVYRAEALDRLVIASGAVPRDYLVLAASAISRAQRREKARYVGVQEVNQAAGDAAASKIKELEEDMASNQGTAEATLDTLKAVRSFCLDEEASTYFLVGFRDREDNPKLYNLLTDLMDVRLIHLVEAGVSDPHAAGHRSEAFMLDLSQYSGARLKQKVRVLDFEKGYFVSRETRGSSGPKVARNALQLIAILRAAPKLGLVDLRDRLASGSNLN